MREVPNHNGGRNEYLKQRTQIIIAVVATSLILSLIALSNLSPIPAAGPPLKPAAVDILAGYTVDLDGVAVTFNLSYRNYGFRGNVAIPGQRFLWITWTELNKGTLPVTHPLGNKYGLRVQFDNMLAQTLNIAEDVELQPGDPLEGGTVLVISASTNAIALVIFLVASGQTVLSIPIPGGGT